MSKKFFDIRPVSLPIKEDKKVLKKIRKKKLTPLFLKFKTPNINISSFLILDSKKILPLFSLFVVVAVVFLHLSAKAEIKVSPEQEFFSTEKEVTVIDGSDSDYSKNILKGYLVSKKEKISREIAATGTAQEETKAMGKIDVINDYHLNQVLVEKTRFLSAEGKLFYLVKGVNIASGTSMQVEVVAAEPGESYNINATDFSIPGLLGSPRYTSVYARSKSVMTGGSKKNIAKITEHDIEQGKEHVYKELTEILEKEIQSESNNGLMVLKKGIRFEILSTELSGKENETKDNFNVCLEIKAETIAFKAQDLQQLAKYFILQEVPEQRAIKNNTLSTDALYQSLDVEDKRLFLLLKVSADILREIDEESIKKALLGKPVKEVKLFLRTIPEVRETKIKLFPFWEQKIPQSIERVEIIVNND